MKTRRVLMSFFGVIICGMAVGFFKIAAFGVDPFQSFMSGIDKLVPIAFGTLYVIVNICLLAFSLLCNRHMIGLATFINLFLLGYIMQFSYALLQRFLGEPSMLVRVICLLIGIIISCFSSSLYMTADLGVSTYDAVALTLSEKYKIGRFQYVRICTDFICVVLGIVLFMLGGGNVKEIPAFVGIGTIVTAFFMGPLIEVFNVKVSRPLLNETTSQ